MCSFRGSILGNMLKTPKGKLALLDFGSMADIDEDFRYGLFGLVMGLQNKDLKLVTENLLKVRFLLLYFLCLTIRHCLLITEPLTL